jgi:chlorite dismutase
VRSDDGLLLIRVVETLHVGEVRDIKGSDVVSEGNGEVRETAVVRDVRVDSDGLLCLVAEVVEEFGDTLVAIGAGAEGVDDPDFARAYGAVYHL